MMITYKFDRLTYGGSEKIKITVPNDFKFIIFDKFNEKQQYIMFVEYYDNEIYKMINSSRYNYCINLNKIGNLMIGWLSNVQPLQELPYISIDELNQKYGKDLNNIYIELYKYKNIDVENIIDNLTNDELINLFEKNKILIETYHLKEFVYSEKNNEPQILTSVISNHNWLTNVDLNCISIVSIIISKLVKNYHKDFEYKIYYKDEDLMEVKNRFNNRVNEIIHML